MKSALAIGIGFSLLAAMLGCDGAQNGTARSSTTPEAAVPSTAQPKAEAWPRTYDEAVARLLKELSDEDKTLLRAIPKDHLIMFHMGWGMGIRNSFGMWAGNKELVVSCAIHEHPDQRDDLLAGKVFVHPDDASMTIICGIWEALQKSEAQPPEGAAAGPSKLVIRIHRLDGEAYHVRFELAGETFETPEALAARLKGHRDLDKTPVEVVADHEATWETDTTALREFIKAGARNVKLTQAPWKNPPSQPDVP
jgi:hypothetical protein